MLFFIYLFSKTWFVIRRRNHRFGGVRDMNIPPHDQQSSVITHLTGQIFYQCNNWFTCSFPGVFGSRWVISYFGQLYDLYICSGPLVPAPVGSAHGHRELARHHCHQGQGKAHCGGCWGHLGVGSVHLWSWTPESRITQVHGPRSSFLAPWSERRLCVCLVEDMVWYEMWCWIVG